MQLWALLVAVLAVRAFADGVLSTGRRRLPPAAVPVRIDINRASIGDLQALPGIGPARAAAILLHRVRHGPFRSPEELAQVGGIGPETSTRLLPHAIAEAPAARR